MVLARSFRVQDIRCTNNLHALRLHPAIVGCHGFAEAVLRSYCTFPHGLCQPVAPSIQLKIARHSHAKGGRSAYSC